jgi:hypothetical protein
LPEPHWLLSVQACPMTLEQVPRPLTAHDCPAPQDALEQHAPLTQLPLAHCALPVQVVPSAPVVTHWPDALQ